MNNAAYRRGFPISLRIVPHSTLVSFLVFRLGKDSLRHRQNSLSPSNRGLENENRDHFWEHIAQETFLMKHFSDDVSKGFIIVKSFINYIEYVSVNCCVLKRKIRFLPVNVGIEPFIDAPLVSFG